MNIYGPAGLRQLIRMSLNQTSVTLAGAYAVHEFLSPGSNSSAACGAEDLHFNEAVGMDLEADAEGVWDSFLREGNGRGGKGWAVSAGPITHRGGSSPIMVLVLSPSSPLMGICYERACPSNST